MRTAGLIVLLVLVSFCGSIGVGLTGIDISGGPCVTGNEPGSLHTCERLGMVQAVGSLLELACLVVGIVMVARRRRLTWWKSGYALLVILMVIGIPIAAATIY